MDGPDSEAATILAAYERTAAAGLARARFEFDNGWGHARSALSSEGVPGWMKVAGTVARPLARRVFGDADLSRDPEEGIVDIAGHRSAMFPTHCPMTMVVGAREWYCVPGEVLVDSESFPADTTQPLWLLALLKGTVSAVPAAGLQVRGERCAAYAVTADLLRASEATPGGLPSCQVGRAEDLRRLPLTVAIDDAGHVRRVAGDASFGATGNTEYMVELWDIGAVPDIDWSRAPELERPAP